MLTFVVPSIGRTTLIDTIESLQSQTVQQWKAIIVFDCVDPSADVLELIKSDHRITSHILTEKLGKYNNCAGEVRNYGIKFVETEWIAFVDDDDCLRPDYIERFHESLEQLPELDCIIFRMIDSRRVLPSIPVIAEGNVGISFCVKVESSRQKNIQFYSCGTEDLMYLKELEYHGAKILISNSITYFVRSTPNKYHHEHIRLLEDMHDYRLINFEKNKVAP